MLEEFKHPISLSPTIYEILKKEAKLQGRAARIHLDFVLREVYSKELSEGETPAIENNHPTVSSFLEEDVKSLTLAAPKTTIGIGYIASTLIKTQAKLNVQSALVTLNEVVKKVYPEEYKLLEDRLVADDVIEIRKLQLVTCAELLTMKNKISRSILQKADINLGDFIKGRIHQRTKYPKAKPLLTPISPL